MWANTETLEPKGRSGLELGERGAALVVALLVMVVCALLGAAAIMTSSTDLQISSQDRVYQRAFANADAGRQWLLSQNLDEMYQMGGARSAINSALEPLGSATGTLFSLAPPFEGAGDEKKLLGLGKVTTSAGPVCLYLARIDGLDPRRGGRVRIQVEVQVPHTGPVGDQPQCPHDSID